MHNSFFNQMKNCAGLDLQQEGSLIDRQHSRVCLTRFTPILMIASRHNRPINLETYFHPSASLH